MRIDLSQKLPTKGYVAEDLAATQLLVLEIPTDMLNAAVTGIPVLHSIMKILPFPWAEPFEYWLAIAHDFFDDLIVGPATLEVTLRLPTMGSPIDKANPPVVITLAEISAKVIYK
jgi:hypothetical protein